MNVPVDEELHERVRVARAMKGQTMQQFVADALAAQCEVVEADWEAGRQAKRSGGGDGQH